MQNATPYIQAFSSLHTAKLKGYLAPHKAILLLTVIDLIEEKIITSNHIQLTDELEVTFKHLWHRYLGSSSLFTPDITKPFFHLQYEPFWQLMSHNDIQTPMTAEDNLTITFKKEKKSLPKGSYTIKAMQEAFAFAELDQDLFFLLQNEDVRALLRVTLISNYLAKQPYRALP